MTIQNITNEAKTRISTAILYVFSFFVTSVYIAHAQVLEQLHNGEIAPLAGGTYVRESQEPAKTEVDENEWSNQTASTSAVVVDSKPEISPRGMPKQPFFRSPKASGLLSREQQRMRGLTRAVAFTFAHHPAVVRAQMEPAEFIALFTAMIRQESNFNARAISNKGAAGLGQLMPDTARDLGVCDVFSPSENLTASAVYLTNMLERFGKPILALAAYNAGPGAVIQYGDIPPYQETQRYVADILLFAARSVDDERQELPTRTPSFGYANAAPISSHSHISDNLLLSRKYRSGCSVAAEQH